jgi:hypothetical protein
MERSRRRRPSPALAVACLALFVALGGTVVAATKIDGHTIKVKSLPGNRLAVASLPANRLKGTIPGNRIAPNSIKGDRIDIGTLGQVADAAHAGTADTARHADTATAADHATDASTINGHSLGCGEGKREFAGACWEVGLHAAQLTPLEAAAVCGREGGELPDPFSLLALNGIPGVTPDTGGEWTSAVRVEGPGSYWSPIAAEGIEFLRPESRFARLHFRCVTPLLH